MAGQDSTHLGKLAWSPPLAERDPGTQKWSYKPEGANVITGAALGTYQPYGVPDSTYKFYFGADDSRVYCREVRYTYPPGTWSTAPVWTTQLNGAPIGTPVLGMAGGVEAVYVCDDAGYLYCLRADTGEVLWQTADLTDAGETITPPLYSKAEVPGGVYAVYVGRKNANGTGTLLAYQTTGTYKWEEPTDSAIVSTPTLGYSTHPLPDLPYPYLYVIGANGIVDKYYDTPIIPSRHVWHFEPQGDPLVADGWIVSGGLQGGNSIEYFALYDQNNRSYVYGLDFGGDPVWTDLGTIDNRLETAQNWPFAQQVAMGRMVASPCGNGQDSPFVFFLSQTAGSGVNRPGVVRVRDYWPVEPRADGTYIKKMISTQYELTSTPIYGPVQAGGGDGTGFVWFITTNGLFYVISPFAGAMVPGFPSPVNLGETIPRQDLSLDKGGAIVFFTADGELKAYWGPPASGIP